MTSDLSPCSGFEASELLVLTFSLVMLACLVFVDKAEEEEDFFGLSLQSNQGHMSPISYDQESSSSPERGTQAFGLFLYVKRIKT